MTSREKVKKLLNRESIDGIVIDFAGMTSTGISAVAYANLVEALGLPARPVRVYDVFQQIAYPDLDVLERMGGDFVQAYRMRPRFGISVKEWREDVLQNGAPCLVPRELEPVEDDSGNKTIYWDGVPYARMPKGGFYYDQIAHPLESCTSISALEAFRSPRMDAEEIEFVVNQACFLYENTDKAIVFGLGGSVFEQGQRDFGYENFYCNIMLEQELMHAYFQKLTDAYLHNADEVLKRAGERIQVIQFLDDLGTQDALQISPGLYRQMIKPYHTQMYSFIHSRYPHAKVMLHCCGAIFDIIPDLIEAGADILNPVQISAKGMDAQRLKDTFGESVIFWGGAADMQNFVRVSDAHAIRGHVDGLIKILSRDGGFVFSQVHNIQHDVPVEKVLAIYEVANRYKTL